MSGANRFGWRFDQLPGKEAGDQQQHQQREQQRANADPQQIGRAQQRHQRWRQKPADNHGQPVSRTNQSKQPFALPDVEQAAGQRPKFKVAQLNSQFKQGGQGKDQPGGSGGCAKTKKGGQRQ